MIQYHFIENEISAEKVKKSFIRKLLIITVTLWQLNLTALAQKPQFPAYTDHINDFAGVVDPATKSQIETILTNFENLSGAQIGVAIFPTLGGRPIEEYANELYRAWKIGAKSGPNKDKGALLIVATEDRRSRLEVGYGLEGDLPDGLAGEMLRRMRPYFQQQQWSQGITVGVRTIVDTLAQKWNLSIEGIDRSYAYSGSRSRDENRGRSSNTLILILAGIFIIFIISRISRGGRGGGGRRGRGGNSSMWWLWPLIFNNSGGSFGGGSASGRGAGGWGGFGGGSGGGGGGGWGGFGGGSSGGGGASDSW